MKYDLTQHARDMLQEREIRESWIKEVLTSPARRERDPLDKDLEHYLGKISQYGNRVLRVIINRENRPVRVVTAFFDRTMKGKL